ncbi:hypothetical protein [Flagellimonas sediminis]|uniref:DoxX family membrane protein n=1 Tax=Flagellimonas sediminis TaxID=2696468 RepID=A0A6I5KN78_9FLAO|nr:hypothetical protein [Allomuricauda sediminis]NDV42126.1 hypothetical protein [Allomuricauda sediminis]
MKPLFVLLAAFALSTLVLYLGKGKLDFAFAGRIALSTMLVFTAIGHFVYSNGMQAMVPSFIPLKYEIVFVTGVLEILFALAILFPKYQNFTAWVLMVFFVLILPANINAAIKNLNYQTGKFDGPGLVYLWFRVPFQIVLILWVYFSILRGK